MLFRSKNVGFGYRHIASVVGDVLGASKSTLLCESGSDSSWYEGRCLVITEAREHRVFRREVVIHADVKLAFVESPDRHVSEVEAQCRVARIACGIKINYPLTCGVKQVRGDLVAGGSCWLDPGARIGRNGIS